MKLKLLAISILGMLSLFTTSCERIDAGYVGLKINMTGDEKGVSSIKYITGWNFYLPGASKIVEIPTFVQHKEYDEIEVFAKGGIKWKMHPAINYQTNVDKADSMYQKFRVDLSVLEEGWMKNVTYQVGRDVMNTFDSDSLLNHREQFEIELAKELSKKLYPYFIVSNITSRLQPPPSLEESIRDKTVAIQKAQAAENNRLVNIKQGEANVAAAEAAARVKIMQAEAEAQSITVKQNALKQSPQYIELIKAERWDGKLPQIISGNGGPGLFMQLPK